MLLATPPLGLDLPTVSADELRSCRVRVNSTTLLACALLLPAGTGTQSLHDFMETMLGTSARRSLPERSLHPTNVHHLHHVRMTALMSAPRTEGKPKCFIMSVRDPVARLKSGFAFLKKGWGPGLNNQVALSSNAARTYSGFIAAMRDPENADHRFAQGLYWSSVSKPTQAQPLHWDSVLGGHNFLVSQLDYLRGWKAHCRSGELHFMCAIIRVEHHASLFPAEHGGDGSCVAGALSGFHRTRRHSCVPSVTKRRMHSRATRHASTPTSEQALT